AEVDHRAHLERHVVARDHVLRRDVEGHGLQAHLHHAVDHRYEEHEARAVTLPARIQDGARRAPEPEDHRALVLAQDARERADEEEERHEHHEDDESFHADHHAPPAFTTLRVSPSTSTTRTVVPASTAPPSATARQSSPWIAICPVGANDSRTIPVCPMSPGAPSCGRRRNARTPAVTTKRNT